MRALLLVVAMLVMGQAGLAQNWKTVQMGDTTYFAAHATYTLRVIWIDSVKTTGGDSTFHFYKSYRNPQGINCIDSMADTWLGPFFSRRANGDEVYLNGDGDTILVKTKAAAGTSWTLLKAGGVDYMATVTTADTLRIDGSLDSAKTIAIQATVNGVAVSNWYNNITLALSKEHGWVKTLDMFMFGKNVGLLYDMGAFVDNNQHFRLDKRFNRIDPADTNPIARYKAGNEWIVKRQWRDQAPVPGPPYFMSYTHDSVVSVQVVANGIIATVKTDSVISIPHFTSPVTWSYFDTSYTRVITINPTSNGSSVQTSIVPEFDWRLHDVDSILPPGPGNGEHYLRRYYGDSTCGGNRYQLISRRVYTNKFGLYRLNGCLAVVSPGLTYWAVNHWRYLEGFGRTYNYYFFGSGDPYYWYDEMECIYSKLDSCVIGTKVNVYTLGIEDKFGEKTAVNLFPNPADKQVRVQVASGNKLLKTDIFDAMGRKITSSAKEVIDVSALPGGVYIFSIITEKGVQNKSMVIQ